MSGLRGCDDLLLPVRKEWAKQVYHLFVIRHQQRDLLVERLNHSGVQVGIHYPIALPKLPAFKYLGQSNERGNAWVNDSTILSLPIGDLVSHESVSTCISLIKNELNFL